MAQGLTLCVFAWHSPACRRKFHPVRLCVYVAQALACVPLPFFVGAVFTAPVGATRRVIVPRAAPLPVQKTRPYHSEEPCDEPACRLPAVAGRQGICFFLSFCVAQVRLPQEISACTPLCGAGFSLRAFAFLRRGGVYPARRRNAPTLRFLECGACLPLPRNAPRREPVIPPALRHEGSRDAARDLLCAFDNPRLVPSPFETFCAGESYPSLADAFVSRASHRVKSCP